MKFLYDVLFGLHKSGEEGFRIKFSGNFFIFSRNGSRVILSTEDSCLVVNEFDVDAREGELGDKFVSAIEYACNQAQLGKVYVHSYLSETSPWYRKGYLLQQGELVKTLE